MGFFACIGRTPFGSLLASLMVLVGAGLFCVALYRALTVVIEGILVQLFDISVSWLDVIKVMFLILGLSMGLLTILLFVFGCLATGATRANIYSGDKCIMGGRISAAFTSIDFLPLMKTAGAFIVVSLALCLLWVSITCLCTFFVMLYLSADSICRTEIYSQSADSLEQSNYCLSYNRFGFYANQDSAVKLCHSVKLRTFCDRVAEAGPLMCVSLGASILVLMGMIIFLICLAANYTRIRISKELTEYRDAVEMEELDVNASCHLHKQPPPYLTDMTMSRL